MLFERSYGIIPLMREGDAWRVLIILREKGFWEFPKGHGESGESAEQAAIRELKEETALNVVSFLQKDPLIVEYEFERKGRAVPKQVFYFIAEVAGEFRNQKGEVEAGEWLSLEGAVEKLTFKNSKELCQKVIVLLNNRSR